MRLQSGSGQARVEDSATGLQHEGGTGSINCAHFIKDKIAQQRSIVPIVRGFATEIYVPDHEESLALTVHKYCTTPFIGIDCRVVLASAESHSKAARFQTIEPQQRKCLWSI